MLREKVSEMEMVVEIVEIGEKGQVTLPEKIREKKGWNNGTH